MSGQRQRSLLKDWPLHERPRGLALGCIVDCTGANLVDMAVREAIGRNSAGWWECDLADNSLIWTAGVYRIFGIADGAHVPRSEAVALYCEDSRAKMDRLRSYAIANGCGFALDAEIRPADGRPARWMRLIGSALVEDDRVTRLHGLKILI